MSALSDFDVARRDAARIPHCCPVPDPWHGNPGDTSTCRHCARDLAVSPSGHWFHVGTGLIGWATDPDDGAHRATPVDGPAWETWPTCTGCGVALNLTFDHPGAELGVWFEHPAMPHGLFGHTTARMIPAATDPRCSCAHHLDGSVTRFLCPIHADTDPCLTESWVTGRRRKGSIRRGVCSACGHGGTR